jgi:hypothetical protein
MNVGQQFLEVCEMSIDVDDPFTWDLIDDVEDEQEEIQVDNTNNTMYNRWDPISTRSYPSVTLSEYSVHRDEDAERYYAEYPDRFVHDIRILSQGHNAHSVNFRVIAMDYENNEQYDVMLRIDTEGGFDDLARHIESGTAPAYGGETGSDNVTGHRIMWKLGWVQFITQIDVTDEVTIIIGESTTFPGYITRVISTSDHNVTYSDADCIFVCLNEALGVRYDPEKVRAILFDNKNPSSSVHIKKDLSKIAQYYKCNIAMHSLDDDTRFVTSKDRDLTTVKLVRMGAAIGIIEGRQIGHIEVEIQGKSANAYYDFETVSNSTSTQAYSFSLIWPNGKWIFAMHHDQLVISKTMREALKEMLDSLPQDVNNVYLHAWNGSRFDHPLLLRMCNERFKIGHTVTNNQREVLSANIYYNNKCMILRDPCKMFPMSLNDACATLGIKYSKLEMDHKAVEDAYLHNTLDVYLEQHRKEIQAYSLRDVQLLKDITESIIILYKESGLDYQRYLTRSMASHALWKSNLNDDAKEALKSVQFDYDDALNFTHNKINIETIKDEAIAGRVQCVRGEYKHVTLLDFKSMYPSVATDELYPYGQYHATQKYEQGRLGLYRVRIIRQNHPHVIPHRISKHGAYDWNYKHVFTKLVTNVDVECLIESDAQFEILDGICWESSTNYFSEHMTTLYDLRFQAKVNGGIALAEHYKHMSNALTGSIFQQLRREYSKVFTNKHDADIYMKMHSKYVQLTYELTYDNGQVLLYFLPKKLTNEHDIEMQHQICKGAMSSKPVILTMFIYAYARRKLWSMWRRIEINNWGIVIYCDTDSLAVVSSKYNNKIVNVSSRLKEHVGNKMGDLEVVMRNGDMAIISPKVYAMRTSHNVQGDRLNEIQERVRVRSVNKRDVLYLIDPNTEWMIKDIRAMGWIKARELHENPMENFRVPLCYDTILELLNGKNIMVAHWYYVRVEERLQKRYTIMILR